MVRSMKGIFSLRKRSVTDALFRATFSTISTNDIADRCSLHVISSPFPPIQPGPYPSIYDFCSAHWKSHDLDKMAILDGSTGFSRTFRQYDTTQNGVAATLVDMGLQHTDCVALYCPNHVDYLPVALAVSRIGAKLTPVNPLYTRKELETVLKHSQSKVLVSHVSKLEVALLAAHQSEHVKHVIVITDDDDGEPLPEGTINLDSLKQGDNNTTFHKDETQVYDTSEHPFLLPYSSGTTGLPKGVCLTHENLVANLLQMDQVEGSVFPKDHKLITPLPFFHIYAFAVSLLYCAWKGQTMITLSKRFDLETYCQLVQEHQPQRTHLVPPILLQLAKNPLVDKYDLSSLQMIISAAAPLSSDIEMAVKHRLDGTNIKQIWGMSELSPVGTMTADDRIRSGSVGQVCSSTKAKIVDEHGNTLGPGEPGELLIQGPQVMSGYYQEADKTAECLSESGWLRTGDLAQYDKDGYFTITDRIKEMIKVRGYPVAPAELEALLLTHEAVNDVAVIQVPSDEAGELARAYIVLKDNEQALGISEKSLYEWVKERVAPYKRLDGGIVFTDAIPKSASGKILRRILRDQAAAET